MFAQLTQTSETVAPVRVKESPQFEKAKKEEKVQENAKKGWKSVNNDFGGTPGSAAGQVTRKAQVTTFNAGANTMSQTVKRPA